jgi:hypothetical protein
MHVFTSIYIIYIYKLPPHTRAFACDVVSKLQRHQCHTFGALRPRNRLGQTGRYIFIYIDTT